MSYQFRFGFQEEDLGKIIQEPNISEKFKKVLEDYDDVIQNQIKEVRAEILRLNQIYAKLTVADKNKIMDTELVYNEFYHSLISRLVWLAINEVFSNQKYNVKENIIGLLEGPKIKDILKERVAVAYVSIINYTYYNDLEGKYF